jgi:hypothetical protein
MAAASAIVLIQYQEVVGSDRDAIRWIEPYIAPTQIYGIAVINIALQVRRCAADGHQSHPHKGYGLNAVHLLKDGPVLRVISGVNAHDILPYRQSSGLIQAIIGHVSDGCAHVLRRLIAG